MTINNSFNATTLDRLSRINSSRKSLKSGYILESGDEEFIDSCIPKSDVGETSRLIYREKLNWIKKKLPEFLINQQKLKDSGSVECLICGMFANTLFSHIPVAHKIKMSTYKEQFGADVVIASKDYLSTLSERVKGTNNPAYQHGGRLSPYSKKFVKYQNLTETETNQKISDVNDKKSATMTPDKQSTNIEYYLAKGMSLEDATKALSERQTTFSLDKCIEKYGILEGTFVWQDRQDRWQATLNSKSDEELQDINSRKISNCSVSKPEKELLDLIKSKYPEVEDQFQLHYIEESTEKKRWFLYDIKVGNVIIEFQGDFWHRNPKLYDKDFSVIIYDKQYSTQDIWVKDARKQKLAEDNGFKFYAVWEHDYKNNFETTMKNIFEFIEHNK